MACCDIHASHAAPLVPDAVFSLSIGRQAEETRAQDGASTCAPIRSLRPDQTCRDLQRNIHECCTAVQEAGSMLAGMQPLQCRRLQGEQRWLSAAVSFDNI